MAPLVVFVDEPGLTARHARGLPARAQPDHRPRLGRAGHARAARRHRAALLRRWPTGSVVLQAGPQILSLPLGAGRRGARRRARRRSSSAAAGSPGARCPPPDRSAPPRSACGSTSPPSGATLTPGGCDPVLLREQALDHPGLRAGAAHRGPGRPRGRPSPTRSPAASQTQTPACASPSAPRPRTDASHVLGTIGAHAGRPLTWPRPGRRHDELSRLVRDARYRYYVLSDLAMPDAEFDARLRELEEIEATHPGAADARVAHPAGRLAARRGLPARSSTSRRCSRSTTCSARTTCAPGPSGCARGLPAGTHGPVGLRAEDRRHRHQLRLPRRRARRGRHPGHGRGGGDRHPAAPHPRRRALPPRRRRAARRHRDPRRGLLPGRASSTG